MFKRLNLKIRLNVLLTLAVCCISIYFISVNGIYGVLETQFSEMAGRVLEQKTQNLVLFQKRVEAIASQIADDEKIQTLLTLQLNPSSYNDNSADTRNISDYISDSTLLIDGKILLYKAIEGAAVFSANGSAVTSGGLSPYPLSLLHNDPGIRSFLSSDREAAYWSVRSENIPDYYKSNRYIKEKGIVTYILKVKNEHDVLLGSIVIDINPEYFYNSFAPAESESITAGISVTLIGSNLQTVPMENGPLFDEIGLSKEGLISRNNDSLRFVYPLSDSGIRMGLDLPEQALKRDKLSVLVSSTIILAVSLIFSLAIAVMVSKCIVSPIRKLQLAMQNPSGYLKQ